MSMGDRHSTKDAAATAGVPALFSEAPLQSDLQTWLEAFEQATRAEFASALVDKPPPSLLQYTKFDMNKIPALVIGSNGATAADAIRRDTMRIEKEEKNSILQLQYDAAFAEYKNNFSVKIGAALMDHAPLLWEQFKTDHRIASHPGWYDGPKMWKALKAMRNTGDDLDHKTHDKVFAYLQDERNKLANGSHPDLFSNRINDFRRNHFPYLQRAMSQSQLGEFIFDQLPDELSTDARLRRETWSATDLADTVKVMQSCIRLLKTKCTSTPPAMNTLQSLNIMAATVRPRDFRGNRNDRGGARDGGGGGNQAPSSEAEFLELYKKCFKKSCKLAHDQSKGHQCWSFPGFEGPLPFSTWNNEDHMKVLNARREQNAKRPGFPRVKKWIPPAAAAASTPGVASVSLDIPPDSTKQSSLLPIAPLTIEPDQFYLTDDYDDASDAEIPGLMSGSTSAASSAAPSPNRSQSDSPVRSILRSRSESPLIPELRSKLEVARLARDNEELRMRVEEAERRVSAVAQKIGTNRREAIEEDLGTSFSRVSPKSARKLDLDAVPIEHDDNKSKMDESPGPAPATTSPHTRNGRVGAQSGLAREMSAFKRCTFAVIGLLSCVMMTLFTGMIRSAVTLPDGYAVLASVRGHLAVPIGYLEIESIPPHTAAMAMTAMLVLFWEQIMGIFQVVTNFMRRLNFIRAARHYSNRIAVLVLLYVFVTRAAGISDSDFDFVTDVVRANQTDPVVVRHAQYAFAINEAWSGVIKLPRFADDATLSICELDISEFGCTSADEITIADSGTARHCFNSTESKRHRFVEGTCRPCPYRVNSASGHGAQPECMGDVDIDMPLVGGGTHTLRLTECLLLPDCPHNLVACGRLAREGLIVHIAPFTSTSYIGLRCGGQIPIINRSVCVIPPPGSEFVGVNAAEGRFEKSATLISPDTVPIHGTMGDGRSTQSLSNSVRFAHWFSGEDRPDSMTKQALSLGAEYAFDFDVKIGGGKHDLTDDRVFAAAVADIDSGRITNAHFGIPCSTTTVLRLMRNPRWPLLRTCNEIYGLESLSSKDRQSAMKANLLIKRSCMLAMRIHLRGGFFSIENPVPRSCKTAPWTKFYHESLAHHGSLWHFPEILELQRRTGACI